MTVLETSPKANLISLVGMLILSPIIFYLDYNFCLTNLVSIGLIQASDIPMKILTGAVVGFLWSLIPSWIYYQNAKKNWNEYLKRATMPQTERFKDSKESIEFIKFYLAFLPLAALLVYLIIVLSLSPMSVFYFIFFGIFLSWYVFLERKKKQIV